MADLIQRHRPFLYCARLFRTRDLYAAPPIPKQVVTTDGQTLFTGQDIKDGQNVWQSIGGQEVGTIWGHGAYVAPDWSADWRTFFTLSNNLPDQLCGGLRNLWTLLAIICQVHNSKKSFTQVPPEQCA